MTNLFKDLFIFEMANNHQGQVKHGLKIIEAMARIARTHGIQAAVKLQYRDLNSLIHPAYMERKDVKHIPRFRETALSERDFRTLQEAILAAGLITVTTPFDERSVEKCMAHGVQILKIASCSADDWPLIEAIVETGKPVIASTGGLSIYEIDNLVSFFQHRDVKFALLHCVGIYPTQNHQLNMGFLDRLIRRYPGVPIGYSGHEAPENLDVVVVAVSRGATILERHVGLPADSITLNAYSMNPEQTDAWVAAALRAKAIVGPNGHKQTSQSEIDSLLSLKRGVYASNCIKKGTPISRDQVFFAMPCVPGQTTSGNFGQLRASFTASQDYACNEPIMEQSELDQMVEIRRIIHDAKGMLFEANMVLTPDDQIELSHHFGIERFRQTGALIVNVVNREYCKKLIIVLPGQRHPSHRHKLKEETFQLIWGDLEVMLNGIPVKMKVGQKLLVERGAWHGFSSLEGAIFEEVSTTHVQGDSYYEDAKISRLDPLQRKTVVEGW